MNYTFPRITHINDVLPAIENNPTFKVTDKDWGKVICYGLSVGGMFPELDADNMTEEQLLDTVMLRECRGMLFDNNGVIISRPFHKFFNLNEREETQIGKVDLSKPHVIIEKLDGSMVRPFYTDKAAGVWRLATKKGITDVSMNAEAWIADKPNYQSMVKWCLDMNMTPLFEWCSRKNRIVIDHPVDRLVLLAIRDNVTGEYATYASMHTFVQQYQDWAGIDVVKQYPGSVANMEALVQHAKTVEDEEGWILRFEDGHMLKVKADAYCQIHRVISGLQFEKEVITLILFETIDDAKALLDPERRVALEKFEAAFWAKLDQTIWNYEQQFAHFKDVCTDVKDFSLNYSKQLDSLSRSVIFAAWSGHSIRDSVLKWIEKKRFANVQLAEVKHWWSGVNWTGGMFASDE